MASVSVIVPSIGRPTLAAALASIWAEVREGDETIVIAPPEVNTPLWCRRLLTPPESTPKKWGGPERRLGISQARGDYLAFLDDDDIYLPGWREAMASAIAADAGRPLIFRMQDAATGQRWWRDGEPHFQNGNMGSPCLCVPNDPKRLGTWTDHREGDFRLLNGSKWCKYPRRDHPRRRAILFRPEIIALLRPHEARHG